jgi:hypothetical protein
MKQDHQNADNGSHHLHVAVCTVSCAMISSDVLTRLPACIYMSITKQDVEALLCSADCYRHNFPKQVYSIESTAVSTILFLLLCPSGMNTIVLTNKKYLPRLLYVLPSFFQAFMHGCQFCLEWNQHARMNNAVFWDVTPYGPYKNRHFGGPYCLHQGGKMSYVGKTLTVTSNAAKTFLR